MVVADSNGCQKMLYDVRCSKAKYDPECNDKCLDIDPQSVSYCGEAPGLSKIYFCVCELPSC